MSGTSPDKVFPQSPGMGVENVIGYNAEIIVDRIGERVILGSNSYQVEPEDSDYPSFRTNHQSPKREGWLYPTPIIHYDDKIGNFLWTLIRDRVLKREFQRLAYSELEGISEPYRSTLHSFLVDIYLYDRYVPECRQDVDPIRLIERSLKEGPSFAEELDALKNWLVSIKTNRHFLSDELELRFKQKFTSAKFLVIGDIYRANNLFGWWPEVPDIVEITQQEVEVSEIYLEKFREKLRALLQNKKYLFYKPNNDYRELLVDNTKTAVDGRQWTLLPTTPAVTRGKSVVSFIPREARGARVAVIEEQASSMRIRWIDREVRKILQIDKRSKMDVRTDILFGDLTDSIKERQRFNHITRKKEFTERWSYCRDFKKEGITKPRIIMRIMMEELHNRFPSCEAFKTYWFFDHWSFYLDGVKYDTKRGHGLGMGNALTTLMQIVIEEMNNDFLDGVKPIDSFYNNDDAANVFENEQHAVRYKDIDYHTCNQLGLAFKAKSTFIAHKTLTFCELYISDQWNLNNKDMFAIQTLGLLMKAINASHSRSLALSMNMRGVPAGLAESVVMYWGPVLFSNEFTRPRCLGGWFRRIERGVDISLMNSNGLMEVPQMEESANMAYKETKLLFKPWLQGKRELPTKRSLVYNNNWLLERGERLTLDWEHTFKVDSEATRNFRAWQMYQVHLKKNFSKACRWWKKTKNRRTFNDIYKDESERRPKEDIIPPIYLREECSSFEASFTDDVVFENPYRATSAQLDLKLYLDGKCNRSYPRKMGIDSRIILGSKNAIEEKRKTPAQRALSLRHLRGTGKIPLAVWNIFLVPNEETFKYWHNPFHVGQVSDAYIRNYKSFIPKYIPESKKELLKLRSEWFGRELHWHEWMTLGRLSPSDLILAWLYRSLWNKAEIIEERNYDLESIVKLLLAFPGYGAFIDSCKNFSIDEITNGFEKWIHCGLVLQQREREKAEKRQLEAFERKQNAFFERLDDSFERDIILENSDIKEFYESRNDPWGLFEQPSEEVIEEDPEDLLDDVFKEDNEDLETIVEDVNGDEFNPDDQPNDSWEDLFSDDF